MNILVDNVDVPLLRKQRDRLVKMLAGGINRSVAEREELTGLLNLLDRMLDIAEGYAAVEGVKS